jgi:hypothetical protein
MYSFTRVPPPHPGRTLLGVPRDVVVEDDVGERVDAPPRHQRVLRLHPRAHQAGAYTRPPSHEPLTELFHLLRTTEANHVCTTTEPQVVKAMSSARSSDNVDFASVSPLPQG